MPFLFGEAYTRDQIHAEFKGEKQSYLPQHDGRIVCGCFRNDSNPDAPQGSEILWVRRDGPQAGRPTVSGARTQSNGPQGSYRVSFWGMTETQTSSSEPVSADCAKEE